LRVGLFETRTIDSPWRKVHCVLSGEPYCFSSQVRHVPWWRGCTAGCLENDGLKRTRRPASPSQRHLAQPHCRVSWKPVSKPS